jgi:hypothetical protein
MARKKKGNQETKQVITAAAEAIKAFHDAKADDGKIDLKDLPKLLPLLDPIKEAVDKINEAPDELLDLDTAEGMELVTEFAEKTGLIPEKAKSRIEAVLNLLAAIRDTFDAFKDD